MLLHTKWHPGPRIPYESPAPRAVQASHIVSLGSDTRGFAQPPSPVALELAYHTGRACLPEPSAAVSLYRPGYRELAELPADEIFAEVERQHQGDVRAQRWALKLVVIELKRRLAQEAQC